MLPPSNASIAVTNLHLKRNYLPLPELKKLLERIALMKLLKRTKFKRLFITCTKRETNKVF